MEGVSKRENEAVESMKPAGGLEAVGRNAATLVFLVKVTPPSSDVPSRIVAPAPLNSDACSQATYTSPPGPTAAAAPRLTRKKDWFSCSTTVGKDQLNPPSVDRTSSIWPGSEPKGRLVYET